MTSSGSKTVDDEREINREKYSCIILRYDHIVSLREVRKTTKGRVAVGI